MTVSDKIKTIDKKNQAKQSLIQFRQTNSQDFSFFIRKYELLTGEDNLLEKALLEKAVGIKRFASSPVDSK